MPFTDGGFVLSIGGAEQSHVDLADPEDIFYEYLRRIGHVVDLAALRGVKPSVRCTWARAP